jgi:hypothetical protein
MERLQSLLQTLRDPLGSGTTLTGVVLTVLTLVAFFIVVKLTQVLTKKLGEKLDAWCGTRIRPIRIQPFPGVAHHNWLECRDTVQKLAHKTTLEQDF